MPEEPCPQPRQGILERLDAFPFRPPFWLRGPHLQTLWGPFFRRSGFSAAGEVLETPDQDRLHLYSTGGGTGRRVLLLHGLEGSRASHYIGGLARELGKLGWAISVLEFRSCSGELNRARRLYHSGETTDLDFVVRRLVGRFPEERLFLAGVSLGGNVLVKWLGERGKAVPETIAGAAAISPPFDLTVSGPAMDAALGGLYVRHFLRRLVPKAVAKERQYPGCLDIDAVRRSSGFADFDTHATAALHGFRDAGDYWARVGCGQFLSGVRCPLLLVAAADDPFNPASTLPREIATTSPYLYPQFSAQGGHVGFVYGTPWRTRHWAEEQVGRFFQLLLSSA